MTKNPFRGMMCILLLALALISAAKARAEVVNQDSLPKGGGEMRGPIKRIHPPGTDSSIMRLYSFDPDIHPDDAIANETLRVLRIWNDHGKPRMDLRPQGATGLTVRISSDRIEMPVMVMVPQATPPAPVVGGMYVSTSGAIYICAALELGWQLMP
jgi:hypothetical protein